MTSIDNTNYSARHYQEVCRRWAVGTESEVQELGGDKSVTQMGNEFWSNYVSRLKAFNENASDKTTAFNNFVSLETIEFDQHVDNETDAAKESVRDEGAGERYLVHQAGEQNVNAVNAEGESQKTDLIDIVSTADTEFNTLKNQTEGYKEESRVWAEGTDFEVEQLGGVKSAKGWCDTAEEIAGGDFANKSLSNLNADGQFKLDNKENINSIYYTNALTSGQINLLDGKDYKFNLTGATEFILPQGSSNYTSTITAYIRATNETIINWGTTKFIGLGIPTFKQGDCLVVWEYAPFNEEWVCSVINFGGF